jgi:hypothetical protein
MQLFLVRKPPSALQRAERGLAKTFIAFTQ